MENSFFLLFSVTLASINWPNLNRVFLDDHKIVHINVLLIILGFLAIKRFFPNHLNFPQKLYANRLSKPLFYDRLK